MQGQLFSWPLGSCCYSMVYLLSSWGLIILLLDPSRRPFILGMHKQLPPASKIAGVSVVSPACVGLCASPITMASSVSCLFPLLSALLWAYRAHFTFLWALQPASPCCFGCHTVPAFLCTGFGCLICRVFHVLVLFTHGPAGLRAVWTVHLAAVLRICGLYSTCLICLECLPGSALKAVASCCWFFHFLP